MDDDETTAAGQSAFTQDQPPHVGADEDPDRPDDPSTDDLAEGGPAGA